MNTIVVSIAILWAVVGLGTASYLHRKKRAKKKLICPLQANCEKVIHSTHATTLGIPNELLGMAYYIILGLLYALVLALPMIFAIPLVFAVIAVMTLGGTLFSIYLIFIQVAVLHAWCSWCLLSALANAGLLVCAIVLRLIG